MAMYKKGTPIKFAKLGNNLPNFAKGNEGKNISCIGIHYRQNGVVLFTTPDIRVDDGRYGIFNETHIDNFVYELQEEI